VIVIIIQRTTGLLVSAPVLTVPD